jgi:hypothetical protein
MTRIEEAIEVLKAKSIENPGVVLPPSQVQIAYAEANLGFKFPPSFLTFLEKAGSYALEYWETYWVGDDSLGYRNIVEANRLEHEDIEPALPPFFVAFYNNGCGDQLCFDTRKPYQDGEYPIVLWVHERTEKENLDEIPSVASNFADWLMQEVENA